MSDTSCQIIIVRLILLAGGLFLLKFFYPDGFILLTVMIQKQVKILFELTTKLYRSLLSSSATYVFIITISVCDLLFCRPVDKEESPTGGKFFLS